MCVCVRLILFFKNNSTLLSGNEGIMVSAHPLREPLGGQRMVESEGAVGWPLSTGTVRESGGIWRDPLDAENQGR